MVKKTILKKRILTMVLLVFLSIAIMCVIPIRQALVFQFQDTGRVLAYIPLTEEDNFQIKYTHSIHLSDVIESYHLTKDREIAQHELMYEDFAIGMPENASEGERFEKRDGKYYIKNMNRVFPSFDLRIGKVRANHTILYKGKAYPLSRYIEPGTWVRIKIEKITLIQLLKGVNILEPT